MNKDGFEAATAPQAVSVGASDRVILGISIAGFCVLAVAIYKFIITRVKTREEIEKEDIANLDDYDEKLTKADISTLNRAQRRARAKAIMKQKRRAAVQPTPNLPEQGDGEEDGAHEQLEDDNSDDEPGDHGNEHRNLSRKERQQAAKLAEKRERHLLDEERKRQQKEAQEEIQREKLERLKLKAKREEEERQKQKTLKEERQKQENDDWLTFISAKDYKLSVDEWINQLKENRIYDVKKAAALCKQPEAMIFDRIETLIREARVAGIVEKSSGYFIYLSDDELQRISNKIIGCGTLSNKKVSGICNEILW